METQKIDYAAPSVMAETLIISMRNIGMRVRLDHLGGLSIGPSRMVWEADREIIHALKEHVVAALQREQGVNAPMTPIEPIERNTESAVEIATEDLEWAGGYETDFMEALIREGRESQSA